METILGQNEPLQVWCIYFNSREFPGAFLVRKWEVIRDKEPAPSNVAHAFLSLADARAIIPPGKVALARAPDDDPAIVETWL